MKVRQSTPPVGAATGMRGYRDDRFDVPAFDLGYIDFGGGGARRGAGGGVDAERKKPPIGVDAERKKPPIGVNASNFVRASFVSPTAGPRRSFRDSQQRRRSSRRRRPSSALGTGGLSPGRGGGRRCFPFSIFFGNLKDALLSCVSTGRTFEPSPHSPTKTYTSPSSSSSKPTLSPRLGVYQLSQAHLAHVSEGGGEESGADSSGVDLTVPDDDDDDGVNGRNESQITDAGGVSDFDATMSSTHSASQPVDKSRKPPLSPPLSPPLNPGTLSSFKKPTSILLNPCLQNSGRDSVSSQGSESFQISSLDRKRALAKSLWTKDERASFRQNHRGSQGGNNNIGKNANLPVISGAVDDDEDDDDDDGFKDNFVRGRSTASSRRREDAASADGADLLLNSFRNSTRSKKSADLMSGSSPPQSLQSHHTSLNSTFLPPSQCNDSSFLRGSSFRSAHLSPSAEVEGNSLPSPRSLKPPPKPSRQLSIRSGSNNDTKDDVTIPKVFSSQISSGRPVPGPQSSLRTLSSSSNQPSNRSGVASITKNDVSVQYHDSFNSSGISHSKNINRNNNSNNNNNNNNNTSILKSKLNASPDGPSSRESFRVRFQRSASTDRPRVRRERVFVDDAASRRRSRSADDYVLNGTPLVAAGNQLRRQSSKVRVLDLSNPEIVSYEMEEADFVAEFRKDFEGPRRPPPRPRLSDDSVDFDLTVRDFLMQNADKNEADRKLLDGFFNYTMNHPDTTSDDDDDSVDNNSISEDSLEVPKTPVDVSKTSVVDEISHGGGPESRGSSKIDFALKIPSYGHNLFFEGISSGKASQDPSPMNGLREEAANENVIDDFNVVNNKSNNDEDTSDYSQDSSEHDSDYARQLRDLQTRMKKTLLNSNHGRPNQPLQHNHQNPDIRPGENSSFDSAFDSLERPTKSRLHAPPSTLATTATHAPSSSSRHRRSLSSPSSSFGFDPSLVPQDLNGNLSTVDEQSRASSVISRRGGGGGGDLSRPSSTRRPDVTSRVERRNVFSVTSADSNFEFDADDVFYTTSRPGKNLGEGGGITWRGGVTSRNSITDAGWKGDQRPTTTNPQVESPDDGVVVSPVEERPSSIVGQKIPHPLPSMLDVKRDSFGNLAPGRVANLRAGFEDDAWKRRICAFENS